jgi:hypothetical protein
MPPLRRDHEQHLIQHQRRLQYLQRRLRSCGGAADSDRLAHELQLEERLVDELSKQRD